MGRLPDGLPDGARCVPAWMPDINVGWIAMVCPHCEAVTQAQIPGGIIREDRPAMCCSCGAAIGLRVAEVPDDE